MSTLLIVILILLLLGGGGMYIRPDAGPYLGGSVLTILVVVLVVLWASGRLR